MCSFPPLIVVVVWCTRQQAQTVLTKSCVVYGVGVVFVQPTNIKCVQLLSYSFPPQPLQVLGLGFCAGWPFLTLPYLALPWAQVCCEKQRYHLLYSVGRLNKYQGCFFLYCQVLTAGRRMNRLYDRCPRGQQSMWGPLRTVRCTGVRTGYRCAGVNTGYRCADQ